MNFNDYKIVISRQVLFSFLFTSLFSPCVYFLSFFFLHPTGERKGGFLEIFQRNISKLKEKKKQVGVGYEMGRKWGSFGFFLFSIISFQQLLLRIIIAFK